MLIGYARVSKADGSQTLDLQRDALRVAGVRPEQRYEDFASGMKDDRPGLLACLKALRERDVLVVWKLDRLGRNLRHLVNTVHELGGRGFRGEQRREIAFKLHDIFQRTSQWAAPPTDPPAIQRPFRGNPWP